MCGCSAISHDALSEENAAELNHPIKIYQNHAQGKESIISNKALASFNGDYQKAPINKAFAQSTSGSWSWSSNRTSIEHAKTSALIACQINNKKSEDVYPCKVIHVNDQWIEYNDKD